MGSSEGARLSRALASECAQLFQIEHRLRCHRPNERVLRKIEATTVVEDRSRHIVYRIPKAGGALWADREIHGDQPSTACGVGMVTLEHTQVRDVTELLLAFNQLGESGEG